MNLFVILILLVSSFYNSCNSDVSSVFTDSSAQQYFVPFINSQFEVQCISTALTTSSQTCGVRYTTDPLFTGLSDEITSMLDTTFTIPGLSADITYYFEFSLLVNSSLKLVDRIHFTAQKGNNVLTFNISYSVFFPGTGLSDWGIVLVVLFGVVFLIALVIIIIVVVKKKGKSESICFFFCILLLLGIIDAPAPNQNGSKTTVDLPDKHTM